MCENQINRIMIYLLFFLIFSLINYKKMLFFFMDIDLINGLNVK